jgi:hypothetical protein
MGGLLTKYRERLKQQHGWEVELKCPHCGTVAVPVFNGWSPTYAMGFGNTPTIYANLNCPKCGAGLRDAAASKLVELFSDVQIPGKNRRLIVGAAAFAIAVLVASMSVVAGVMRAPALVMPAGTVAVLSIALMRLYFVWFNWQVTSLRHECACGNPAYKFMGMLGRSYCYRCSSCSSRIRLRD